MNAYMFYAQELRLKFNVISRKAAYDEWIKLSEIEKIPYKQKEIQDNERYEKELSERNLTYDDYENEENNEYEVCDCPNEVDCDCFDEEPF